jgi:hypothetical protein
MEDDKTDSSERGRGRYIDVRQFRRTWHGRIESGREDRLTFGDDVVFCLCLCQARRTNARASEHWAQRDGGKWERYENEDDECGQAKW